MGNADASEVARNAARARWGNQVVSRAASVVIERAAELPESMRAEVIGALIEREDVTGDD